MARAMHNAGAMDAIKLLDHQHEDVDALFEQLEQAREPNERRRLFYQIADQLAIHTTIEERHFYPAVRSADTEAILDTAFDEHAGVKRLLGELLEHDHMDDEFTVKCRELMQDVQHHVEEERNELFPKVRRMLDAEQLEAIGQEMTATMTELEEGEPRETVLEIEPAQPTT